MQRTTLYVLAAAAILAFFALSSVFADETVHGYTIPTVSEDSSPLRVCTTTRTRQWSNEGSSDTHAMYCPNVADARRTVTFAEAEKAAAFLSENINFGFDSAALDDEAILRVEIIATFLAENSAASLSLNGHADAVGPEEYNLELSERRAEAARVLFTGAGVSDDRITTISFGELELLIDTAGPERLNRRVEIIVSN